MEHKNSFRLETKRSERLAGWSLLLPLVFVFWVFTLGLALLFLSAFAATAHRNSAFENLFVIVAIGLIIGLVSFLTWVLTGKLHDVLANYEFSEYGVVKGSPLYRQEARWSQVAGWALSVNSQTWWLLNDKGRPLLSIDWHLLPSEKAEETKAFVCKQLLRLLPYAKWIQPSLWQQYRFIGYVSGLLTLGSFLVWYANRQVEVIAIGATLILTGGILIGATYSFQAPARSLFIVHGDWLSTPNEGINIHLPTIKGINLKPYGMLIVTADDQQFIVPKEFEWLIEYVRRRMLQRG